MLLRKIGPGYVRRRIQTTTADPPSLGELQAIGSLCCTYAHTLKRDGYYRERQMGLHSLGFRNHPLFYAGQIPRQPIANHARINRNVVDSSYPLVIILQPKQLTQVPGPADVP